MAGSVTVTVTDPARAVEAVWRMESARVIAGVARIVQDVGLAEELAQDALVAALERWPRDGVPANPGGWLMLTAKNRAIDLLRRRAVYERKLAEAGRDLLQRPEPDLEEVLDDPVGDDLLRLVFIACHPVLRPEQRAALTLKLLGGLTTDEIARAFLVSGPTAAQRIVRAKRTLAAENVPFALPTPEDLADRLRSVLGVIYLIFNEGYSATAGDDWIRPTLCEEALRLGRVLAGLVPDDPEVHGLVALMELQASRFPARTGPGGAPVLLQDQDRRRWDRLLIRRGLESLERSVAAGPPGPYTLQAAIAACHARAHDPADTDWHRIAGFYALLVARTGSPVVRLNHAVAVGMAEGPEAGLALLEPLADALARYPQFPAARAELLSRMGRGEEARAEFARAASLTASTAERALFQDRAARL